MRVIVKKYGGTSVSSVTKIKNIAKKVVEDATDNKGRCCSISNG